MAQPDLNDCGALLKAGREAEALQCFATALRENPRSVKLHAGRAAVLAQMGRLYQAIDSYREALSLKPFSALALSGMASVCLRVGDVGEAVRCYRMAAEARPDLAPLRSSLLFSLNFDHTALPEDLFREHRAFSEYFERAPVDPVSVNDRPTGGPLRVGYLSAHFYEHTGAFFTEPLLAAHRKEAVHITCYSNTDTIDGRTARMRSLGAAWRDINGMSDTDAFTLIRNDGIDILVDFGGHTGRNRLSLFALKPAPIQVTYLGYPNTTGLKAMDYRITDEFADPAGMTERYHSEELVRLPNCFVCFRPAPYAPEVGELPALRTGRVTFASFNKLAKFNPAVIDCWSAILRLVPGSRLILHHAYGSYTAASPHDLDPCLVEQVRSSFARRGVEPDRIELLGSLPALEHLKLHQEVDLSLDPFPYNGTTTLCQSLWMGVPAVVLAGKTHVSRVGVSLMTNVGLPEFIAPSVEAYVDLAVRYAHDLDRLAQVRAGLRERMAQSPLTDSAGLTHALEEAYQRMWERWRLTVQRRDL